MSPATRRAPEEPGRTLHHAAAHRSGARRGAFFRTVRALPVAQRSDAKASTFQMRLSQVLVLLAAEPEERISFRDILAILSERSFAILVVLLGLPNCLPMPPPIPTVSSLLLIMIAVQM